MNKTRDLLELIDTRSLPNPETARIAVFTHDAYGLGHVRRSLHIIQSIARRSPNAAILLITGSPAVDLFKSLPENADYLKIPTIVTSGIQGAKPPVLGLGLAELSHLRRQLILEALITFSPDVFVVDNFPLGSRLELLPSLIELRKRKTRTILGLRDIADPPAKVRADWGRDGIYQILDRYYSRILVYGMQEVLDVSEAYGLSSAVAAKVRYCGYITSEEFHLRSRADVRAELGITGPYVLATVGGGGDGFPLMQTFLDAMGLLPDLSAVLVTGEFMSLEDKNRIQASARPGLIIRGFVRDLPSYMAASDVVVAMGGYNTAAEILALRPRAIIVPRHWKSGEHSNRSRSAGGDAEQLFRAQALSRLGYADMIHPDDLTAEKMAERIKAALESPLRIPEIELNTRGVESAAEEILAFADNPGGN